MNFCIPMSLKSLPDPANMQIDINNLHHTMNRNFGLPKINFCKEPNLQIDIEMTEEDWEAFRKHSDQVLQKMLHDVFESGIRSSAAYENGHKVIEITDYIIYEEESK